MRETRCHTNTMCAPTGNTWLPYTYNTAAILSPAAVIHSLRKCFAQQRVSSNQQSVAVTFLSKKARNVSLTVHSATAASEEAWRCGSEAGRAEDASTERQARTG